MTKMMVASSGGEIAVDVTGEGPVILCVHGWPEHSWSWRHQVSHFSKQGYRVAAMDVRGYGDSFKPREISAYSLPNLASDVAAVAAALSDQPVILVGHDWGAPITYTTALIYPERVRALAGMSVPYMPSGDVSLLDILKMLYADKFFYMLYFQAEGVAEAELEADLRTSLRKIYYWISGDIPETAQMSDKPVDAGLLDGLTDPDPFPAWLTDADLEIYVNAFTKSGFRGPLNRYRAIDLDHQEMAAYRGQTLDLPTCFIGGARDPVRQFVPGVDAFETAGAACTDFRGTTIIPNVGHWVQQEAPTETNAALAMFFDSLS
ncbi:MAG: alpha/beta hydrolase [Pseudomonadota bacterium]